MVNCDCESFGKYRITKWFIHQSASLHCDFAKFWNPRFSFLDSTLFHFHSTFWLDSRTLRLNYTMLWKSRKWLSGEKVIECNESAEVKGSRCVGLATPGSFCGCNHCHSEHLPANILKRIRSSQQCAECALLLVVILQCCVLYHCCNCCLENLTSK